MANYYNEIDLFAAEWLRNLIKEGLIPDGEVDTRSISDVVPNDLAGFTQCHFFAGIAGWSHALRLAGWPDDRHIWTGSAPCQPFSVAGKGKGTDDERHLWPAFFRLIAECRPPIVIGEQVASKAGRAWLSRVFADLESVGYAGAGADLCAAGVGAPHIRQRLYWVGMADAESLGRRGRAHDEDEGRREQPSSDPCEGSSDVVDAEGVGRREGRPEHELRGGRAAIAGAGSGDVADADSGQPRKGRGDDGEMRGLPETQRQSEHGPALSWRGGETNGSGDMADADDEGWQGRDILPERPDEFSPWARGVEWRRGADGKERRTKRGILLLVNGISGGVALERTLPSGEKETHIYSRVGALRGFGNAIVPPLAAEVIKAFMDV